MVVKQMDLKKVIKQFNTCVYGSHHYLKTDCLTLVLKEYDIQVGVARVLSSIFFILFIILEMKWVSR